MCEGPFFYIGIQLIFQDTPLILVFPVVLDILAALKDGDSYGAQTNAA